MILDKNLRLIGAADPAVTETKAVPLGQNDLSADAAGLGPYQDFWFVVKAGSGGADSIDVTLQHCGEPDGTFEDVVTLKSPDAYAAGDTIVKAPVPPGVKNWLRVKLSAAVAVEAFFVYGVDKEVAPNV
jgi:hypothetical protein